MKISTDMENSLLDARTQQLHGEVLGRSRRATK
jgi:hypothetical protein